MFNRILDRLEEWIIGVCMAVATLVIFVSVLHRQSAHIEWLWTYTGRLDFTWAQELCIFLFIWMAKFGAAYGVRTGIHIGVDVLVNSAGPRVRKALIVTGFALGALFTGTIALLGARWVMFTYEAGQLSADLEWPRWILYLCLPLGSGLMCYRFLQAIWAYLKHGRLTAHGFIPGETAGQ